MLKKGTSSRILLNKNSNKAVILVHAFRANPHMFSELSTILFNNNYSVFNIRLPGHGCVYKKDIHNVRLRDWEIWLENIILDVSDKYEVYLIGASLGAALIIELGKKHKSIIKKIVILSPILKFKQTAIFLSCIIRFFKKTIKRKGYSCSLRYDFLKDFYDFYSIPQIYQIYKLTRKIKRNIKFVDKVLCFLSKNDEILDYSKHVKLIKKHTNFNLCTLEKSNHTAILDVEKEMIIKKIMEWIND